MKIYLIADTHFGHENIKIYSNRPDGFEEMILKELKKIKGDVLIHLGDFCFGKDEYWHKKFMEVVNCQKKWLIRGNHDKKTTVWYLKHGWDWVGHKFQERIFGKNILFSHAPVSHTKIQSELDGAGSFDLNIHGHLHDREVKSKSLKHKLVSIEKTNYKPVNLEKFISLF